MRGRRTEEFGVREEPEPRRWLRQRERYVSTKDGGKPYREMLAVRARTSSLGFCTVATAPRRSGCAFGKRPEGLRSRTLL